MKYILFIAFLFFPLKGEKMVKVKIADGITVMLPETFTPMTAQDLASKYLSARTPLASYTSSDRVADFTVNTANSAWAATDIEIMHKFNKANINSLFTAINFSKEEIIELNGRKFSVFEFVSVLEGEESVVNPQPPVKKYNYILYTIVNNQSMIFSFSAPASKKQLWEENAREIMQSIKINKH